LLAFLLKMLLKKLPYCRDKKTVVIENLEEFVSKHVLEDAIDKLTDDMDINEDHRISEEELAKRLSQSNMFTLSKNGLFEGLAAGFVFCVGEDAYNFGHPYGVVYIKIHRNRNSIEVPHYDRNKPEFDIAIEFSPSLILKVPIKEKRSDSDFVSRSMYGVLYGNLEDNLAKFRSSCFNYFLPLDNKTKRFSPKKLLELELPMPMRILTTYSTNHMDGDERFPGYLRYNGIMFRFRDMFWGSSLPSNGEFAKLLNHLYLSTGETPQYTFEPLEGSSFNPARHRENFG